MIDILSMFTSVTWKAAAGRRGAVGVHRFVIDPPPLVAARGGNEFATVARPDVRKVEPGWLPEPWAGPTGVSIGSVNCIAGKWLNSTAIMARVAASVSGGGQCARRARTSGLSTIGRKKRGVESAPGPPIGSTDTNPTSIVKRISTRTTVKRVITATRATYIPWGSATRCGRTTKIGVATDGSFGDC